MVIPVLAHMGGIDEIGIFLIPALLAIYALRRAERLARRRAEAEAVSADGSSVAADDASMSSDEASDTDVVPPSA